MTAMDAKLKVVLQTLRAHENELHAMGVGHAAIFGSVAHGEERADSNIDVLVDLDRERPMGVFEYARLKLYIGGLFSNAADVVNRKTLKPLLRDNILRNAIDAF
jgi:predicted nucleotidyltransferase